MSASNPPSFISIVGSYEIDPRDVAAFLETGLESIDQTINKQGCLYYISSQDLKEKNVFHLAEGWASQADLDHHLASPSFKKMLEQAFKLRILRREIYISQSTGRTLMA